TTCFKNWFNYNTGCIEEQYDDGSTICDSDSGERYVCSDGTDLGDDVFSQTRIQYCGVDTGECDGAYDWEDPVVEDYCNMEEYCVPGQSYCEGCIDSDNDGVCDDDEDESCVGENEDNLPDDTICREWSFNHATGCHEYDNDDGTTVCDTSSGSEYVCMPNNEYGDVFLVEYDQYCGVNTGICNGVIIGNDPVLADECSDEEICSDGACIPKPITESINVELTPKRPYDTTDLYCNAEIVSDEFTYVDYYVDTGIKKANGTLECDEICTLSLKIGAENTKFGEKVTCTMSFDDISDSDYVNVYRKYEPEPVEHEVKKIGVSTLQLIGDEFVKPGETLQYNLGLENKGVDLDDVEINVNIMGLFGAIATRSLGPFDLEGSEDFMVYIEIPEDTTPGIYYARFSITEGDEKRVKHRMFYVI
ncbi:MAG: hypothetical protein ACLFUO_05235, partial [Candidatus Woesearchaeota archaeon]